MLNTDDVRHHTEVGTGYSKDAMLEKAADEIDTPRQAIATAYGHLWHVNTETKPKSTKPKAEKPPKTETVGDMHQSLKKAGYERGTLPMNGREIRVGLNMDAPFSDQRFEAVINRRGDQWVISEIETPELKSVGMVEAMTKFRADLAALNEGKWPAAETAAVDARKGGRR